MIFHLVLLDVFSQNAHGESYESQANAAESHSEDNSVIKKERESEKDRERERERGGGREREEKRERETAS